MNADKSNIRKLTAQLDIIFSNSMIESVNKRMKYDYLFTVDLENYEQTLQYLEKAVDEYNNKPHSALFGLSPAEVFNGMIPDKTVYKNDIKQAAAIRTQTNLSQNCLNCYTVL